MHRIDDSSLLHGLAPEGLIARYAEILVVFRASIEILHQPDAFPLQLWPSRPAL